MLSSECFWNLKQNSLYPELKKDLYQCQIMLSFVQNSDKNTHFADIYFGTPGAELLFAEFKRLPLCLDKQQYEQIAALIGKAISNKDCKKIIRMCDEPHSSSWIQFYTKSLPSDRLLQLLYIINSHPVRQDIHNRFEEFISHFL